MSEQNKGASVFEIQLRSYGVCMYDDGSEGGNRSEETQEVEKAILEYVEKLEARVKEQDDLLTSLKKASMRVSLPEDRPVDVARQSDSTWVMDLDYAYALVDLDRGGYVVIEDAKAPNKTVSGSFHWDTLEDIDLFLTLLLASRKTYIEKGVARYRAETGL